MPVRISKNRVALENIPLNEAKGADIASASTINLDSATGNLVHITGSTTITAITLSSGHERTVIFDGALTLTHNSTTLILPGNANIATSGGDRAIFRGDSSGVRCISYTKSSGEPIVGSGNAYNLTNIIYPRADGDWRGIYRGGWRPSFFNQQWGGAQWGNGPDGSLVDFATGYIDSNIDLNVAQVAGATWVGQGFKVPVTDSYPAILVKIYKVGNPTNNLELRILPDDGSGTKPIGSTPITNGTATAQSGKIHTANTGGEWARFVFPTPPSLTANTVYHLTLKPSGVVDASNYWIWKASTSAKYPHGNRTNGDGTPTWTAQSDDCCFLVENGSTAKFLQSSGQFDGKLVFAEGSPLDQSKGLCQPLRNFFDGREFTYRGVFASLTKDKTVADCLYGLDHDRVVLRCNATTGYMQVDVYESDGTKHTVTGTTDCSSGTKDIAIYIRAKGDGADAVKLYVNGVSEGTPISNATITFSPEFRDLGTAWVGGGFPIAPTWTKDTAMGSLPSADGWTYTGTATEGNAFSVSSGKLYQNYNGYAATDTGYYSRTTTLSNTNGWTIVAKLKILKNGGAADNNACVLNIADGTKALQVYFAGDYYISVGSVSYDRIQLDMSKQEHVCVVVGKGNDFFFFVDGRLMVDGTGLMTATTASNTITFGDATGTSGANADAIWDYVKDYSTAWLPPQFTSGSLSEAAFFSGDRTSILSSLYNGGTFKSVREYCGIEREYVAQIVTKSKHRGTGTTTTTSTSQVLIPSMEAFCIGEDIRFGFQGEFYCDTSAAQNFWNGYIDGAPLDGGDTIADNTSPGVNYSSIIAMNFNDDKPAGLHKVEIRWHTSAGTLNSYKITRVMYTEVK